MDQRVTYRAKVLKQAYAYDEVRKAHYVRLCSSINGSFYITLNDVNIDVDFKKDYKSALDHYESMLCSPGLIAMHAAMMIE